MAPTSRQTGGSLALPGLTSYDAVDYGGYDGFHADGAGSVIDLSALTSVTQQSSSFYIQATSGGKLNLMGLRSLTGQGLYGDIDVIDTGHSFILASNLTALVTSTSLWTGPIRMCPTPGPASRATR